MADEDQHSAEGSGGTSDHGSNGAIYAALGANLGVAVTKAAAFALTGASSMLAESIHSVADSGNQILLLVGGHRARRDATEAHPFGFSRVRYYYAFLVSVVLFTVGGLFALYEAWHKYAEPEPIESWHWVPVTVLAIAMVLEGASFRTAVLQANKVRGRLGWRAFLVRVRSPELPVILLEDFAALVGLFFAMFGVVMTLITHDGRWDALGAAMIGALLCTVAVILGRETKSMLVGEAATPEDVNAIRAALAEEGFEDIVHLRTSHLGPEDILLTVKVAAPGETTLAHLAQKIDAAEARIRKAVPAVRLIYIEPDVRGIDASADGPDQ